MTQDDSMNELKALRQRWCENEPKWRFVIETFWQRDYPHMVALLGRFSSLDDAVAEAQRERDGMVAT